MPGGAGSCRPLESRSPLDSLNGLNIKVELKNGHEVPCKLDAGSARNLVQCVNCGFYALKWHILVCSHSLCERCFMECQCYYCALDQIRTMKFKAKSGSCNKAVLKDVLVQCLYCSEFRDANTIADHIEKEHSSLFEEESSGTPNAVQNKEELYSSKVLSDLKLHSSRDKDPELLNLQQSTPPEHPKCATSTKSENTTCRHCGKKVKDIPNHLAVCSELPATCPYCHDEIRKKDMKAHVDQCDRESKEARKEHEDTCQDRITECEDHEGALPEKDFEPHCSELCKRNIATKAQQS
ncbi:uncharacterized protein LOC119464232 isoform X2 [Dermacentor silvarum]|uniref:uncharacterized protein LOC119464232 isoform X2 n=1 Tax=Dermacentor silvarum TaxID=543639 RepID=UPI002101A012|nr:uncharacterized protein LOC119464232 isoform X2 [Dermacentor silvarum]